MQVQFQNAICPNFRGFGVQHDVFLYTSINRDKGVTDEDIQRIEARVREMRPSVARTYLDVRWWNPSLDGETFVWESEELNGLRRLLDLYSEWNGQFYLAVWRPMPWAKQDLSNLVKALTALLVRLVQEEGYEQIRYLSPYPRPDQNFEHGISAWIQLLADTQKALADAGLDQVGLTGPEIVGDNDEWLRFSARKLGQSLSLYAFQEYASHLKVGTAKDPTYERLDDRMADLGKERQLVVSEFSLRGGAKRANTDWHPGYTSTGDHVLETHAGALAITRFIQECTGRGVAGLNYFCLHDMYYPAEDGEPQLMQYGLWKFKDHNWAVRQVYHIYRLFSRFAPGGTRTVPVRAGLFGALGFGSAALPRAFTDGNGHYSIFVLYKGEERSPHALNLTLAGMKETVEFRAYRFTPQAMQWIGDDEEREVLDSVETVTVRPGGKLQQTLADRTLAVYTNFD